jgi:hypothetical protein
MSVSIRNVLTFWRGQVVMTLPPQSLLLCFDDAIDRANIFAAGGVVVTDALNASIGVDDVDVAFADGFGGAFRQAGAARNAIVLNFHSHDVTLLGN